jgi:hypothetical protein
MRNKNRSHRWLTRTNNNLRYLKKVRATTFYGDSRLLADVFRQRPLSLLRKRYIFVGHYLQIMDSYIDV